MPIVIPVFKNESWKKNKFDERHLLDFRYLKNPSPIDLIREISEENHGFIAAEGYSNTHISQMVLENLISEVLEKVKYKLDTTSIQLGYGYTMTSLYNTFLKNWMTDNLTEFPTVYCGTWEDNNTVYKKYIASHTEEYLPDDFDTLNTDHIPTESFQMDEKLITDTLEAVSETNGIVIPINEIELKSASKLLRKTEAISTDYKEAYALAAFIKQVESGTIHKGKHVIILNDAKTISRVDQYDESMPLNLDDLLHMTTTWLAEYRDSNLETREALENALKKGFILIASREGTNEGICVIVDLGFDVFIPKYHLAYIGTSDKIKGRGIGSELIQRAIDLTEGNLSLHVDLDNKGAKKVYEKYGFEHVYNRMLYKEKG
jgi:threonine synthase